MKYFYRRHIPQVSVHDFVLSSKKNPGLQTHMGRLVSFSGHSFPLSMSVQVNVSLQTLAHLYSAFTSSHDGASKLSATMSQNRVDSSGTCRIH